MTNRIKFESENYFFYFNKLKLKPEFQTSSGLKDAIEKLNEYFKFQVTEIIMTDSKGIPFVDYKYNYSKKLPPDKDKMCLRKIVYNDHFYQKFVYSKENPISATDKQLQEFLNTIFTVSQDKPIEGLTTYASFQECGGFDKNVRQHSKRKKYSRQFTAAHEDAYGSEIEKQLADALQKAKIEFKIQQKIFVGDKLFTILDFYIENGNLAIYCDGFKYHYDKETVIKDRKQDRILQFMDYKVLRYTGSEIVGDVSECVYQIKRFIDKYSDSKNGSQKYS